MTWNPTESELHRKIEAEYSAVVLTPEQKLECQANGEKIKTRDAELAALEAILDAAQGTVAKLQLAAYTTKDPAITAQIPAAESAVREALNAIKNFVTAQLTEWPNYLKGCKFAWMVTTESKI